MLKAFLENNLNKELEKFNSQKTKFLLKVKRTQFHETNKKIDKKLHAQFNKFRNKFYSKNLNFSEAQLRALSILKEQTNFLSLHKIIKSNLPTIEKETIFNQNMDYKISYYEKRLLTRTKTDLFHQEIILKGIDFGDFADIEKNIYYCLDNADLLLNGFLTMQGNYIFFINPKLQKKDYKAEIKGLNTKINTDILKQYNKLRPIPLNDYKTNTALLYALMHERNKTDKGANKKGYQYRDFIISVIQEFIYCNYRLYDIPIKNHNQNLIKKNLLIDSLLSFLHYRNAKY
ncbi:hypothetical protein [Campylobacter sp. JMF_05 ED3]|uniref:hypothetical protein n=1 Tax=Campylobacter sp. JMF_05 ED3 TaxID=2983838 RepID=UPI0022E9E1D4|nr:hypothetical protein [Campylobacter sp. JMF_05 ED3]